MEETQECEFFINMKQGYCRYRISENENPLIYSLFVEEIFRRSGYARKLLNFAISEIRSSKGFCEIEIYIEKKQKTNNNLIRFYKSLGLTVL